MCDGFRQTGFLDLNHEVARLKHAEIVADLERRTLIRQGLEDGRRVEQSEKRFYRLYLLRHILFRLAPRLAARLVL